MNGYRTGFFYGDYKVLYCVGAGTFARVFRAIAQADRQDVRREGAPQQLQQSRRRPTRRRARATSRTSSSSAAKANSASSSSIRTSSRSTKSIRRALTHYIVMDFVEGRNLREFYRARRRFEPLEAAHIMEGVMSGLNYALQQGITHRDLKMSNVLLSSDGEPKLVDFGLAGVQGEAKKKRSKASAAARSTTPAWSAPPGVRKDDPRSDIFFAGTIFYQMLAGQPALAGIARPGTGGQGPLHDDIKPILDAGARSCRCRWRWSSARRWNSIPTSATKRRPTCWSTSSSRSSA